MEIKFRISEDNWKYLSATGTSFKWKQRVKNQPKSPFNNQPTPTIDTPVRVRLKPDSKERVFRPEQKPAYIFSLCS
jgi:hypothetical protein